MFEYLSVAICFVYLCETKRHMQVNYSTQNALLLILLYSHKCTNKLLILNKHFPLTFIGILELRNTEKFLFKKSCTTTTIK